MLTFTLNKRHIYLLLIILLATSYRCGNNHHTVSSPQTPTEMLCSGDLVFRLGRSLESRVIASDGKYSHIGIIIRKDSSTLVAHIEPSPNGSERTKYESLEDFFHPEVASSGAVMRINELDSTQRDKISAYLLSCADITFDHDYILSDSTKMYCTELVYRAYKCAGLDITHGIRHKLPLAQEPVVLPSDIFQQNEFEAIWSY